MKGTVVAAAIWCLSVAVPMAQERLLGGLVVGSNIFDGATTQIVLHQGGRELNPVVGSIGVWPVKGIASVGELYLLHQLFKNPDRRAKKIAIIAALGLTAVNIGLSVRNYQNIR